MYKAGTGISPEIINELLQSRGESYYNLRYISEFIIPRIHIAFHGTESVSYDLNFWELIPSVI